MASTTTNAVHRIGQGFCGSVWASSTHAEAIKREDGGPGRSLHNEFVMLQKVLVALSPTAAAGPSSGRSSSRGLQARQICIPRCHRYVQTDDVEWWTAHLARFPSAFQIPCNVLVSDRIPPFPQPVRDILTDLFCPASLIPSIKASQPDRDCILRPYLGRRGRPEQGPPPPSRFQAFSLRNLPLHVDRMERLELDVKRVATMMAETLALLYWTAAVDANDVEFVLAPARVECPGTTLPSAALGTHALWIVDFDCCKDMARTRGGVEQAARAFWRNDPYFPRPGREGVDRELWELFRGTFLEASLTLLGVEESTLAELWVRLVEENADPETRREFMK
jgi:hypothetical protein